MKEEMVETEIQEADTSSSEVINSLTASEFEELKKMNQNSLNLTMDIGDLEIQKMAIEQRRKNLEQIFEKSQIENNIFTESLREKYGDININISTGEFIKINS